MGSLSYADVPNVNTFHYTVSTKSHLLIVAPVSSEKCMVRSCQAHSNGYVSQSSEFTQVITFYHWQQMLVIFFEVRSSSYSFSHLTNHNLSVVLLSKNSSPWKKAVVHLITQTCTSVFSPGVTVVPQCVAEGLHVYSPLCHTED